MFTKLKALFVSTCMLAGCSSPAPEIHTLCEQDAIGNYLIKWETDPALEGMVKIYVSENPDTFPASDPVLYAPISDGVATYITKDNVSRSYFMLTFNDKYPQVAGSRVLKFDHARNFRDMGGYAAGHKQIRWGQVFRSDEFIKKGNQDSMRFSKLGIKTIIDLREEEEVALHPLPEWGARRIPIPIHLQNRESVSRLIQEGKMRKRDVLLYMQDQYLNFMENYSEQYAEALSLFAERENYPIVFNCSFGKDRAGFLAMLLLAAIGASEETILLDYTLSSGHISTDQVDAFARDLGPEGQEAFTVLLSSPEAMITPTLLKIKKEYGSMDNYLTKKMHLTEDMRKKIKDILLYESVSD